MTPQPLIALWTVHPGDPLGEPIQVLTHGPVTHAGFLRSDGRTVHENYFPKVRNRPLLETEPPGIRLFQLAGLTPELAARFERFFDLSAGADFALNYSVGNLFDYVLNRPPQSAADGLDCSAYVAQTIRRLAPALAPLVRIEDWQVAPATLLWSPRLLEVDWKDLTL